MTYTVTDNDVWHLERFTGPRRSRNSKCSSPSLRRVTLESVETESMRTGSSKNCPETSGAERSVHTEPTLIPHSRSAQRIDDEPIDRREPIMKLSGDDFRHHNRFDSPQVHLSTPQKSDFDESTSHAEWLEYCLVRRQFDRPRSHKRREPSRN